MQQVGALADRLSRGRHALALLAAALSLATAGCAGRNDLRFSAHAVIEAAPVHHAIERFGAARPEVPNGAIPALYGPDGGIADVAGHADTQALRHSLAHPDLRIILTVTEARYRIVARRSAGIATMADLRGKRIATPPGSSAAYYLHRALGTAGMSERDVTIVPVPLPPRDAARLLVEGRADALALWEPEPEIAIETLGEDAVILDPESGYSELYNLHSTAAKLADPATRAKIVRLVAALIKGARNPDEPISIAARITGYPADPIRRAWPTHAFPAALSPALLDTLVAEEGWLAANEGRPARSREELRALIDPSIEAEARAWLRQRQ
ncbi:MAG: ABC transporter substrate-binding protein [Sphingomonadales bacterium]|nr:ABC transporter substrate-binding protein [Sphingomonadales bacterium]